MKTVYFVKMRDAQWNNVVFLLSADSEEHATELALQRIADFCRHEYSVAEITAVCQSPDTVDFEPV